MANFVARSATSTARDNHSQRAPLIRTRPLVLPHGLSVRQADPRPPESLRFPRAPSRSARTPSGNPRFRRHAWNNSSSARTLRRRLVALPHSILGAIPISAQRQLPLVLTLPAKQ